MKLSSAYDKKFNRRCLPPRVNRRGGKTSDVARTRAGFYAAKGDAATAAPKF